MKSGEVKYWIGFNLIQGIGPAKFFLLLNHFGDLERAWEASASELAVAGLDRRSVEAIASRRSQISLEAELDRLEQYKVKVITWNDPQYPRRLKEIDSSPPVLYVRGSLLTDDECCIAIVGTRRASAYGRQSAEELAGDLARNGITIVSGLARGIDTVAHEASLQAGGRTIAVSACGLDMVYPSSNAALARRIIEQGALISEFPLGATPRAEHFPLRNRIISGMSLGVLVVEAGERSGALITAHQAAEQNREVFAVPGNIFSSSSKGTNNLIQEGAKLVRNCSDIFEELNLSVVAEQLEMKEIVPASDVESQLLSHLSSEGTYIDEICHRSGLPISAVSGIITMLELKGLAKQVGNATYALT
jgi:DNA processing protein